MTNLARRCVAEALGTFALVAIGPGAVMVAARTHAFGNAGIALAFGLVVAVVIASSGKFSGAHINPAVTLGLWSVNRFPAADVLPYVAAQCVGAVLASVCCGWMLGPVGAFGATVPNLPLAQSFGVEAGYSALLALVIMGAVTRESSSALLAPLTIGATVCIGAFLTGPWTGGSFNPARSLGPAVASGIWTAHWLYWCAPVVGMVAAMQLYEVLRTRGGFQTRSGARLREDSSEGTG